MLFSQFIEICFRRNSNKFFLNKRDQYKICVELLFLLLLLFYKHLVYVNIFLPIRLKNQIVKEQKINNNYRIGWYQISVLTN